jgi:hypothetical protein
MRTNLSASSKLNQCVGLLATVETLSCRAITKTNRLPEQFLGLAGQAGKFWLCEIRPLRKSRSHPLAPQFPPLSAKAFSLLSRLRR